MEGPRFSERVRRVLATALDEARQRRHESIGTEHLLLALLREREGVAKAVLAALGVDQAGLTQSLDARLALGASMPAAEATLPYTSRAKQVLELTMAEAHRLQHSYIGTEHLLLGLVREESGIAAQLLTLAGISMESARAEIFRQLGSVPSGPQHPMTAGPLIRGVRIEVEFADGAVVREAFTSIPPALSFLAKHAPGQSLRDRAF